MQAPRDNGIRTLTSIRTKFGRDVNGNRTVTATYYDTRNQRYTARQQVDGSMSAGQNMLAVAMRLHDRLSAKDMPLHRTTFTRVAAEWREEEYFWAVETIC